MKSLLVVKNLTKTFDDLKAVDDISFSIQEGEIVALLGPNGAGKTTTIKCLTSLTIPDTKDSIFFEDLDFRKNLMKIRRRIGVCPQELNLYNDGTVMENLLLQGYFSDIPQKLCKQKALELLKLVELTDKKDTIVKKLSGGMKRKLQITRALITNPKIIFFDEPTVGLSPEARNEIWNQIRVLKHQGISILLTTHYMEEADNLADRVLIMNHGKIIAEGSSESLKDRFIGNSQVLIQTKNREKVISILDGLKLNYNSINQDEIVIKSINGRFPEVFRKLEGIEINEITLKKPSLEDVFLELTGNRFHNEEINNEVIA